MQEGKILKDKAELKRKEHDNLILILRKNVNAFAWSPADMSSIDIDFLCHYLALDRKVKPAK